MKKLFLLPLMLIISINILAEDFPVKGYMRTRVDFWKKVYTEITTNEAFLHDSEDLTIIYKKVELPKKRRARRRFNRAEKKWLRNILNSIAKKDYKNLNTTEQKIAQIIGKKSKKEIRKLKNNLRFQYGLKDRYYKGLINSYQYLDYIKQVFREMNMPERLAYLPHVESSFNYRAYSKVGAAGIWQFMRSTARRYKLKVNYVVDERRDVIKSTKAAAKFLKANYKMLKAWPLALTAYNHGPLRIKRAIKELGTREIHKIIEHYNGRRFGFASKNFYATYMATVEISENPEKYFKSFKKPKRFNYSIITLNRPYTITQIMKKLGINKTTITKYNPSIRPMAFRGAFFLPKNFKLHIPQISKDKIAHYQNSLKSIKVFSRNFKTERMHIISRGENLFDISRMYKVALNDVILYNQIQNPSRIYAGMKLKIPGKESKIPKKTKPIPTPIITQDEKEPVATSATPKPEYTFVGPKQNVNLEKYELDIVKISKDIYQVRIEADETLGHLADWAKIPTQRIRDVNYLRKNSIIRLGQKIKIPINERQFSEFKRERNEYHLSIQEDFFNSYKITEYKTYKIKRGDTISRILKREELPFWIIRQVNDDFTPNLYIGQKLLIPEIEEMAN